MFSQQSQLSRHTNVDHPCLLDQSVKPNPAPNTPTVSLPREEIAAVLPNQRNDSPTKIGRSIVYMMEHINEPLSVSTLAALADVSSSHFFALFKQHTGYPPIDYFTQMRMRHACKLFDSGRRTVKEVAAELGYEDPFYFSRVFKSVHQMSPSEYRDRNLPKKITEPSLR